MHGRSGGGSRITGPAARRDGSGQAARRGLRAPSGRTAIGGRRAVAEALRSGWVREVMAARGIRGTEGLREVLQEARRSGIEVRWVERGELDALGILNHQGVAAVLRPMEQLDERAIATVEFASDALVVVLDGITDPQNLGACGRSAEAAGASMLVTRKRRAAPMTAAPIRASAGALAHLPVARVTNISRAIDVLKDRGFFIVGLDQGAQRTVHDGPEPERPLALVVGSEERGMARLVRERCDLLLAIPMPGRVGSLNASAALAVGLFAWALRTSASR